MFTDGQPCTKPPLIKVATYLPSKVHFNEYITRSTEDVIYKTKCTKPITM